MGELDEPNKRLFVNVGVAFDVRVIGELHRASW
jgi:hypothetical protein